MPLITYSTACHRKIQSKNIFLPLQSALLANGSVKVGRFSILPILGAANPLKIFRQYQLVINLATDH